MKPSILLSRGGRPKISLQLLPSRGGGGSKSTGLHSEHIRIAERKEKIAKRTCSLKQNPSGNNDVMSSHRTFLWEARSRKGGKKERSSMCRMLEKHGRRGRISSKGGHGGCIAQIAKYVGRGNQNVQKTIQASVGFMLCKGGTKACWKTSYHRSSSFLEPVKARPSENRERGGRICEYPFWPQGRPPLGRQPVPKLKSRS